MRAAHENLYHIPSSGAKASHFITCEASENWARVNQKHICYTTIIPCNNINVYITYFLFAYIPCSYDF